MGSLSTFFLICIFWNSFKLGGVQAVEGGELILREKINKFRGALISVYDWQENGENGS